MEVPIKKTTSLQNYPKIVLALTLILILFTIIPLYYPILSPLHVWNSFSSSPSPSSPSPSSPSPSSSGHGYLHDSTNVSLDETCNIFTGEWVRNPEAPYYTNTTCRLIDDRQNCMKYGRPDSDFMKWRWKPDDCELPIFDPTQFLELVRGKSMAFVGDSLARNHMQSLFCLLSRVQYPMEVFHSPDYKSQRWHYPNYNFTFAIFWSQFLVRAKEVDPNDLSITGLYNVYLDEVDVEWTNQTDELDYIIISAGHWFFRPMIYYEKGQAIGCFSCRDKNLTDLPMFYGYRRAFGTAFRAINSNVKFKGTTFLRTFTPAHFENGTWNEGGNCLRRRPFRRNETILEGYYQEIYKTQVEEFKVAEEEGRRRGLKFRLLDVTQAMVLRPDGHPGRYGHWPNENVSFYNDCGHWCLPGPVDAWNDFLLHVLKIGA